MSDSESSKPQVPESKKWKDVLESKLSIFVAGVFATGVAAAFTVTTWVDSRIEDYVSKHPDLKGKQGEKGDTGESGAEIAVGVVTAWPVNTKPPKGWLVCDGKHYPNDKYPDLATVMKNQESRPAAGNPEDLFSVPNYQYHFLRGSSENYQPGEMQGYATALPSATPFATAKDGEHDHVLDANNNNGNYVGSPLGSGEGTKKHNPLIRTLKEGSTHFHKITGGDEETRPMNVAVQWIIYAGQPQL